MAPFSPASAGPKNVRSMVRPARVDRIARIEVDPLGLQPHRVAAIWRELVRRGSGSRSRTKTRRPPGIPVKRIPPNPTLAQPADRRSPRRLDRWEDDTRSLPGNRTNAPGGPSRQGLGNCEGRDRVPRRATTARRRQSPGSSPRARRLRSADVTVRRALSISFPVLRPQDLVACAMPDLVQQDRGLLDDPATAARVDPGGCDGEVFGVLDRSPSATVSAAFKRENVASYVAKP